MKFIKNKNTVPKVARHQRNAAAWKAAVNKPSLLNDYVIRYRNSTIKENSKNGYMGMML